MRSNQMAGEVAYLEQKRAAASQAEDEEPQPELSWVDARLTDLRLKTMAAHLPQKPYWNAAMVSAWVAVIGVVILLLGSVGGLWLYTKNTYLEIGDQQGYQRRLREETQEKLTIQDQEINRLKGAMGLLPKVPKQENK